jgi:subtilisin-like proprotein convertase family protein
MKDLIDLSPQIRRGMNVVLCFVTVMALLALPLPGFVAQNSSDRAQKRQSAGEAPAVAFTNSAPIVPADRPSGTGTNPGLPAVYPSTITVAGLSSVSKITVTFAVTGTFPDDLDVLLIGPTGAQSLVMSDAGASADLSNVTYTFDQAAAAPLPDSPATASPAGSYQPSNYAGLVTLEPGGVDSFPAPGPGSLNYPSTFNVFNGTNPNGDWSLYVVDDENIDSNSLPSGWTLNITPTPVNETIYATSGNDIATFSNGATGVVSSVPVTGLQAGESLVGIDVRPQNSQLYGVGSSSRLYTINPLTGAATQVGAAGQFTLSGTQFGMDFNPTVDRIRVVSNTGQNIRLNPTNGTLAATDTAITPAGVVLTGIAYDRNDLLPATPTTLYAIDDVNGVLTTLGSIDGTPNSPNGGVVGPTLGSLGLGTALDQRIGFDISTQTGFGFATILTGGTDKLYQVNLTTGAATLVGTIGTGTTIYSGMAFAQAPLAGEVSLSGRVTSGERGITNARVTVSGGSLVAPTTAVTGRNGGYVVSGLTAGETYLVTVTARRFSFENPSRVITLNDNLGGVDFQGTSTARDR